MYTYVFQDTPNRICGILTVALLSKALSQVLDINPDCLNVSLDSGCHLTV